MGAVYRATDSELGREVALKILPEKFAQDRQMLGRFQREAELLASLNHPHISIIHGLEESGELRALINLNENSLDSGSRTPSPVAVRDRASQSSG